MIGRFSSNSPGPPYASAVALATAITFGADRVQTLGRWGVHGCKFRILNQDNELVSTRLSGNCPVNLLFMTASGTLSPSDLLKFTCIFLCAIGSVRNRILEANLL
jgi:hypothetical protein